MTSSVDNKGASIIDAMYIFTIYSPECFGRWCSGDVICAVYFCFSSLLLLITFCVVLTPYHTTGRLPSGQHGVPRGQRRGRALPRVRMGRARHRRVHPRTRAAGDKLQPRGRHQRQQRLLRKVSLLPYQSCILHRSFASLHYTWHSTLICCLPLCTYTQNLIAKKRIQAFSCPRSVPHDAFIRVKASNQRNRKKMWAAVSGAKTSHHH